MPSQREYLHLLRCLALYRDWRQGRKRQNHVVWYETMIIAGGALGNIWIVFEIPMPLTSIFLAVYGLFAGVYVGCLVMALAEMLRVIPILVNRLQIKEAFYLIPLAIAIGKITGTLFQYFYQG